MEVKIEHFVEGFKFHFKNEYNSNVGTVLKIDKLSADPYFIIWENRPYPINYSQTIISIWLRKKYITPMSFVDVGLICKKNK